MGKIALHSDTFNYWFNSVQAITFSTSNTAGKERTHLEPASLRLFFLMPFTVLPHCHLTLDCVTDLLPD